MSETLSINVMSVLKSDIDCFTFLTFGEINPCAAKLFVFIFHSFENGIVNAICKSDNVCIQKIDISNIELLD